MQQRLYLVADIKQAYKRVQHRVIYTCAARGGHVLQWAKANGCPWDKCTYAAANSHLHVLQWGRVNGCPWDKWTCMNAFKNGHWEVLRWGKRTASDVHCRLLILDPDLASRSPLALLAPRGPSSRTPSAVSSSFTRCPCLRRETPVRYHAQ